VDQIIYADDALVNGWQNWSWDTSVDFSSTDFAHTGSRSVKLGYAAAWAGFRLNHNPFCSKAYASLIFWINGGIQEGRNIRVQGLINNAQQPIVPLDQYIEGGSVAAGTWRKVTIPLADLGIANTCGVTGFWLQENGGGSQTPFYVDDISLLGLPPPAIVNLSINTGQIVRTVDDRMFGINAAIWDGELNKPETIALLKAADNKIMRFPGGSAADSYHWQTNISEGNNWQWASNFDAFANVARGSEAQAFITVNYGSGTPQEASDWVRYANVTHKFGFKYWEIGNENYGSWEHDIQDRPHDPYRYAQRAKLFIDQMKAVDPTIKIGVVAVEGEDSYANYTDHPATNPRTGIAHNGWTPVLLATLKSLNVTPDFLIYHRYAEEPGTESDAFLLQAANDWKSVAADLRQQLTDYLAAAGANVELVVTENNSISHNPGKQTTSLVNGLFLADSLGNIMQTEFNSFVWWDLRNAQEANNNNSETLYGWRQYGDFGIMSGNKVLYPTYYIMQLMAGFARGGDQVVGTTSDYDLLSVYAAKRSNGKLSVLVINKNPSTSLNANIQLAGFTPLTNAKVSMYGIPQDVAAQTGTGSPAPASYAISNAATAFTATFPPYSATIVSLQNAGTPLEVATGMASAINSTSATVQGTANPNGSPTTAKFEYGSSTAYGFEANIPLQSNNGSSVQNVSTTISGLQPGITYHYRLSAKNSEGMNIGNDATFTLGNSYKLHGVNFSPILDGQNENTPISQTQLEQRMGLVKDHTHWVRTFGASNGLENAGAVAHKLGLKIAMGAWISNNLATNETEINNLIAAANRGEADMLIVGSETVLRAENGTTPFPGAEAKIIEYLNRVKNAVPASLPVTYADTYNTLLNHPNLVAACRDVLFVNYYPYWEGVRVDKAMLDLNYKHEKVVAIAGGKKVIVSEAGWPSAGAKLGEALPSLDNASWYFLDFVSWARSKNIEYFYFEAFNSVWKSHNPQLPAVESHWGILDGSDYLKFGMEKAFNNTIMDDNWTLVDGVGEPSLEFTLVPSYGTSGINSIIYGKAKHIKPAEYKVALYIYIPNIGSSSGWWIKPYSNDLRNISLDAGGEWNAYTVTGGSDEKATKFAAFLVPKSYTIPTFGAAATLPAELYLNSVASVEVTRPLAAFPVKVAISNTGFSTVASDTPGINCGYPNYDCSENYAADSTLILTATPSPGYKFTGWSGDCANSAAMTCTLTINAAKSVGANFMAKTDQHIIFGPPPQVVVGGTGTVSATGGKSGNPVVFSTLTSDVCTISGNLVSGEAVGSCTIAANQTGNDNYNDAPTVTQSFNVTTGFALIVINSNKLGGTLTSDSGGINCGETCSQSYVSGALVKLFAIPKSNEFQFTSWGGACNGNGNTCTVIMDTAKTVTANFDVFKKKRRHSWLKAVTE
jgi:exo-beta-1,3-glucanase (GH17 family)